MSERKSDADNRLRVVLCANEDEAAALRSAGFRSVRVVGDTESIFVQGPAGFDVDPMLDQFGSYFLAFPVGSEGLRDSLAVRLGDLKCRWVSWPDECAGAASTLQTAGTDALRSAVLGARPMWTDEVCLMSDIPEPEPQKSYTSGFAQLDRHGFRLIRPAFMPVIGPYGSGKSVLVRQLCCNLRRLHGWRTLITSFEERVKPRYLRDFRRHFIGTENIDNYTGEVKWVYKHLDAWTAEDVAVADAEIEKSFRFLRRKRNATLDVERLVDRIEYAVRVYGLEVVVIDPVNEIDHQVPKGENKTDYMGRFIMSLKQLADDYDLLMIVCAYPPKDGVEKRMQKGKLMTLNDGADTAHYGNKADIGWCVWRATVDECAPTYLNIDKLKDHEVMGVPTVAELRLDKGFGCFNVTRMGYDIFADVAA